MKALQRPLSDDALEIEPIETMARFVAWWQFVECDDGDACDEAIGYRGQVKGQTPN
jgi:hypothetical protein